MLQVRPPPSLSNDIADIHGQVLQHLCGSCIAQMAGRQPALAQPPIFCDSQGKRVARHGGWHFEHGVGQHGLADAQWRWLDSFSPC